MTGRHERTWVFRMLLRMLPGEFREAHGQEMEQAFHAERADAARDGRRTLRAE